MLHLYLDHVGRLRRKLCHWDPSSDVVGEHMWCGYTSWDVIVKVCRGMMSWDVIVGMCRGMLSWKACRG